VVVIEILVPNKIVGGEALRGMLALLRVHSGWWWGHRCCGLGVCDPVAARMTVVVDFVSKGAAATGLGGDHRVLPTDSEDCVATRLGDILPYVEWAGDLTAMLEAGQKFSPQGWWGGGGSGGVNGAGAGGSRHGEGPSAVCVPAAATRGSMVGVGAVPSVEVVGRQASGGDDGGAPVLPVSGADGLGPAEAGRRVLPQWDVEGLAAVNVTIRHPLAPIAPVGAWAGVEQWRTRQAEDKGSSMRRIVAGCGGSLCLS